MAYHVTTDDGNLYVLLDGIWRSRTDPQGARFLRLSIQVSDYDESDGFPEPAMADDAAKLFGGGVVEWVGESPAPVDQPPSRDPEVY